MSRSQHIEKKQLCRLKEEMLCVKNIFVAEISEMPPPWFGLYCYDSVTSL